MEIWQRRDNTDPPFFQPTQYQIQRGGDPEKERREEMHPSLPGQSSGGQKHRGGRHGHADLVSQHGDEHQRIPVLDDELDYFIHGKGSTEPIEEYFDY
jgi:hypothetical protein